MDVMHHRVSVTDIAMRKIEDVWEGVHSQYTPHTTLFIKVDALIPVR